ncbi:hypothetical protein [Allorhizocola rhizosphaerae]|uniref:hypothetical protein n=1 Tax=Allorhizocola rhizosphaerae TaxID=1872709 RepID=UPI000E3C43C7|nr:hypothetical protein [Allorhizocola rhizosphaerae]
MGLTNDQRDGLNIALNEAIWLNLAIDVETLHMMATFEVLTLRIDGSSHEDTIATLILNGVSRVVASLRNGWWNDPQASIEPLELADFDAAVRSFGGCPVNGWEFIDLPGSIGPTGATASASTCTWLAARPSMSCNSSRKAAAFLGTSMFEFGSARFTSQTAPVR